MQMGFESIFKDTYVVWLVSEQKIYMSIAAMKWSSMNDATITITRKGTRTMDRVKVCR